MSNFTIFHKHILFLLLTLMPIPFAYAAQDNEGLNALVGDKAKQGMVVAKFDSVSTAASNKFTIDLVGNGLINFAVNETSASYTNEAGFAHQGGKLPMSVKQASVVLDNMINTTGISQARMIANFNGIIVLQ